MAENLLEQEQLDTAPEVDQSSTFDNVQQLNDLFLYRFF